MVQHPQINEEERPYIVKTVSPNARNCFHLCAWAGVMDPGISASSTSNNSVKSIYSRECFDICLFFVVFSQTFL